MIFADPIYAQEPSKGTTYVPYSGGDMPKAPGAVQFPENKDA